MLPSSEKKATVSSPPLQLEWVTPKNRVIVKIPFVTTFSQMTRKLSFVPRLAALSASPSTSGSFGLRQSPSKHWYNKLCAAMRKVGLTTCTHDPCVFTGSIIDGKPPLYLSIYINDSTYFLPPRK
jgi:hypothetical protein